MRRRVAASPAGAPVAGTAPDPPGSLRRWLDRQTDVGGAGGLALFTLFGLNLVDEFDRLAFATLSPEIRDAFGLSDQQIVAIGSVSSLFVFVAAIPVGYLADRMSRVLMARAAAVVWGCMALLTGAAWTLPVLFAARFFSGFAKSSNDIVHTGLLADYYPPRALPRVFKVHRLANPLSQVASLAAGAIAAALGWRWAFVLLAIPTFLLLGTLSKLREPDRGATVDAEAARAATAAKVKPPSYWQASSQLWRIRSLRRICLGFFVLGIGAVAFGQMLALYFEDVHGFGPLGRGFAAFLFGVGNVVGILGGGDISARRAAKGDFAGLARLAAAGFVVFSLGVLIMGAAPWAWLSLLGAVGSGTGVGALMPIFPSLIVRILPAYIRSQGQSFSSLAIAVGGLFGIPIVGFGEHGGYRPAFVVLAALIAASCPVLHSVHKLVDRDVRHADESLLTTRPANS
jgi:MFS family permease